MLACMRVSSPLLTVRNKVYRVFLLTTPSSLQSPQSSLHVTLPSAKHHDVDMGPSSLGNWLLRNRLHVVVMIYFDSHGLAF